MSITFNQTRDELILDAFQLIGVYGIGRTVSSEDMAFAARMLNKMVKAWGAKGLHLFAKEEAVLYLTPGIASYALGDTEIKATRASDESVTQLNGAFSSTSTILTVNSTSGMTVSDKIGVVLSDETVHWTTISSIGSQTSVTIASGLSGAASDKALVYSYTTTLERPLRVLDARKRSGIGTSQVDIIVSPTSYQDYQQFPTKNTQSGPTQFMFNPAVSNGVLTLWPTPYSGSERILITYERVLSDLNNASDTFDFPPEWLEPLTYQLSMRLARPFGRASALRDITLLASTMLKELLDWDAEVEDIQMEPDVREY